MSNSNKLQTIGTYQLPVKVAEYLVNEDQEEDMEDALGDDLSYFVSEWLESLPGLQHKHFSILSERPDRLAHAMFCGEKEDSVKVHVSATLCNLDVISELFLLDPEKAASLCRSYKSIIGNLKPEQLPMASPEAIKDSANTFPDAHTLKSVYEWANFGSPLNQILFIMLIDSNK